VSIRVWKLDDYDFWAGETLESVIAAARQTCGPDTYEDAETIAIEFTVEQLEQVKYFDEDEGPDAGTHTLADDLRLALSVGVQFPCMVGSLE
jgi:hypothetical protein